MNKTILNFLFSSLVISVFVSCSNSDIPDRTEETEKQELSEAIANVIAKGYNVDTTSSGVYYVMWNNGKGAYPAEGDTCHIIYKGYYLNGAVFDASYFHSNDSIWKMVYKTTQVIPGFDDAISKLNKGASGDFIIPSRLAYGATGNYPIPPYTPIVFKLTMRDLRPKK